MKIDFKGVKAFSAVVQFGGFDHAAQALHITQSAVSQRVKQLESRIGHTLLIRSSPPQPTPAGATVLKFAQQLDQLENTLIEELQPTEQKGWLRIAVAVNADTLATWLLTDCLADWCRSNRVLLELNVDDQEQTHHLLQNGSVIGCISGLEAPPQGCRSYALGASRYLCVSSPAFFDLWFDGQVTQEKLHNAPMIRFNSKDFLQHQYLQEYYNLDATQIPTHTLPSSEGFLDWIKLGMGWGLAPYSQVKPAIENGDLVELTPGKHLDVHLYWHLWGLDTELTRSLTEALMNAAQRNHAFHESA